MSARSIHPFPARMAPDIALDAIPENSGGRQLVVIDPMCGSGTVLAAAAQRGQHALGIDIDPLAVMMSTVATARADFATLGGIAADIAKSAKSKHASPPWSDEETDRFADYWFGASQRHQLIKLAACIAEIPDDIQRTTLMVALSRTIVTKSPQASLAADAAHSRPHRVISDSDFDVFDGFEKSARNLSRLLGLRQHSGTATVRLGDSRTLGGIEDGSADMAVTSPPYLNALDYLRGHKLALIWFGYSIPTLREIRRDSIGAERGLDTLPDSRATELCAMIEQSVTEPDVLPKRTLLRFAHDMVQFSDQLRRVLRKDGTAIVVVGNSTLKGNYIRNDLITQRALESSGFQLVTRSEREIPPQNRYMATKSSDASSAVSKRMRFEVVLNMRGESSE
ncbi:hypothetical protein IFU30_16275 [Plantibacter sp. CFBP 8798]|uniref:hypothetical protein n=1 Tax=Plantibacter sp. CFBP 8798 TaxID=2775268 RepID=UPI00177EC447|nr:hypothetical protein [Plantibacter sp. CFBP 8798]MBD8467823.1 hypothetical protein [Plantibacter sp. CFBP 8798]